MSGRSSQSAAQGIYRSAHFYVDAFGSPLPVLVTEALKFADSEYYYTGIIFNLKLYYRL